MADIKEFELELNKTFESFKDANDKALDEMKTRNGEVTAETAATVEKINTDITEMRKALTELETKSNRPSFDANGKKVDHEAEEEQEVRKAAYINFLRHGKEGITVEETRALSSASDASGSWLCPTEYDNKIIMKAYELAQIRPKVQVGTTGRDSVTLGLLAKPAVAWGRQLLEISPQTLTAGQKKITIYDLKALITISNNTLDDSESDLEKEIIEAFGRACAEAEDNAFAVGAGDDSPQGISNVTTQANYVASGIADDIVDATHNGLDKILDSQYKIKATYRARGSYLFNSNTEAVVRKLKNGNGDYMWTAPVEGKPALLHGKQIVIAEGMPDIAAGAFPVFFGDLYAGYAVRDRSGITIQRLLEKYATLDQTGFMLKRRVGGMVVLDEAFACLKIAVS